MNFLINIIWTFVIVGIIIFFHELGHFLAAKRLGIKVERFSIGFGPKMVGFTKGETEYRISWLPFFGGYVKMLGENPAERPDDDEYDDEEEVEEGRFDLAPVWQRAIIALSGPGMNIVLAVIMYSAAYMVGLPAEPDTSIALVETDSPAEDAGIERGDRITAVNGYKVKTWGDIQENVMTKPGEELRISLLRDGKKEIVTRATPENIEIQVISVDLNLLDDLNKGTVSSDLRQEFGIAKETGAIESQLSANAMLTVEESGESWVIADSDAVYHIRKEDEKLDVLQETENDDMELIFGMDMALRDEQTLQNSLDRNIIPEALKRKFDGIDAPISEDYSVFVEEPGSQWLITDKSYGRGIFKWLIPGKDKKYQVKMEDDEINVYLRTGLGKLGLRHSPRTVVRKLEDESTASKAGIRIGDVVKSVNNNEVLYSIDFNQELQDVSGESVTLTVERDGDIIDLEVPLEYDEKDRLVSFNGMAFEAVVRKNPIAAVGAAVPETIRMGGKVFQFLKRMVVRDISVKYVAGPLGIVQIALAVVETGVASALQFAGFLSVNLGIVNLLPLFITDGAMVVFLIIEALRRKPLEHKKQMFIQQLGVGFIILFFLLVTYNDIIRIITGGI